MITRNEQVMQQDLVAVKESRDFELLKLKIEQKHAQDLKKIEIDSSNSIVRNRELRMILERIFMAIIKLPIILLLVIPASILWLRQIELPTELEEFFEL